MNTPLNWEGRRVLAFDQATVTGWAFGSSKLALPEWQHGRFSIPKRADIGERLNACFHSVCDLIDRFNPTVLAYERVYNPIRELLSHIEKGTKPKRAYNVETIEFLQKVAGIVAAAGAEKSVPTEFAQPSVWRKTLIGSGFPEDPKRAVLLKLRSMGIAVTNEDESDALGICFHHCHGAPALAGAQADLLEQAATDL